MLVEKRNVGLSLLLLGALGLGGCASVHYARTDQGELRGDLLVKWVEPDLFVFVPVAANPLTFVRVDQTAIVPGPMYTDGGSIPRPLWALPAYSPWGYAPAFVVHDWLFDRKHCGDPTYASYTVTDAAWVMSEVMKTMIESRGPQPGDKIAVYSMFEAVRSPIAEQLWEHGPCKPPPPVASSTEARPPSMEELLTQPGKLEYLISCGPQGCS